MPLLIMIAALVLGASLAAYPVITVSVLGCIAALFLGLGTGIGITSWYRRRRI